MVEADSTVFLTILWAIGITAEGMTGALAAGREKMDLFGVIMVACVTAVGGGSIRDVLLDHHPLSWVEGPQYLVLVSGAAILTVSIARIMHYFRSLFLILDSLGLIVFAIFGTRVAMEMGYGYVIAVVASIITGVSGGIMRDLLCNRIPLVFHKELYASICLLVTSVYMGLEYLGMNEWGVVIVTLLIGLVTRLLAIKFEWALPVFDYQEEKYLNQKPLLARLRGRNPKKTKTIFGRVTLRSHFDDEPTSDEKK